MLFKKEEIPMEEDNELIVDLRKFEPLLLQKQNEKENNSDNHDEHVDKEEKEKKDEKDFPPSFSSRDESAIYLKEIFQNLSQLPWIRVDVSGRRVFAHTDIIVRSTRWNKYGIPITKHAIAQVKQHHYRIIAQ